MELTTSLVMAVCTPENVRALVEGAIFTRSPKEKKNTALFIGGSDMVAGEKLLDAVQKVFFADFRVSVMLDSNGSNTTAAAAVAKLMSTGGINEKKVVILGGTGPGRPARRRHADPGRRRDRIMLPRPGTRANGLRHIKEPLRHGRHRPGGRH